MKILVINAGSSSLKFKLFKMLDESVLCLGQIESIGKQNSRISFEHQAHSSEKKLDVLDHEHAFHILFDLLFEEGLLVDINELYAVGHRVVHGGDLFSKATKVSDEMISQLKELIPLAPLHNPSNIAGISAVKQKSESLAQVAVFDTAFHHSIPDYASRYALPSKLYFEDKIQRYGFHGSSYAYVSKQASKLLDKPLEETTIISLHLGNGASACAIKNGRSIDTSMGMTPLEGLVMGTRSGDIDPSIIFYLSEQKGYSVDEIDLLLNKQSGLLGLCGDNDMRLILAKAQKGNEYQLALDIYVYRIKKYIGAYLAILGSADGIVFTGGIGENSSEIREQVLQGLEGLNIYFDPVKNREVKDEDFFFNMPGASINLMVIKTDEELEIALQTREVLQGEKRGN